MMFSVLLMLHNNGIFYLRSAISLQMQDVPLNSAPSGPKTLRSRKTVPLALNPSKTSSAICTLYI